MLRAAVAQVYSRDADAEISVVQYCLDAGVPIIQVTVEGEYRSETSEFDAKTGELRDRSDL